MPTEFSLIESYFKKLGRAGHAVELGIGDDAAVVNVPDGYQVVMSVDTLLAGVHFPKDSRAADIAYKALAVNLSDLAAMAAKPAWFLLSLTLPSSDENWLAEFSQSLGDIAGQYQVKLIGGDTCLGPLSITIQISGLVESGRYLTRNQARSGDLIVVSGSLGNASLGLAQHQNKINLPKALQTACVKALNRPVPRLCLADFLQTYASAAIDISDGLIGDLRHILENSDVGALVRQIDLPVNQWIKDNDAYHYALSGGDDYELCFTMPSLYENEIKHWNMENVDCPLKIVGEITHTGYYLSKGNDKIDLTRSKGYQHFGA